LLVIPVNFSDAKALVEGKKTNANTAAPDTFMIVSKVKGRKDLKVGLVANSCPEECNSIGTVGDRWTFFNEKLFVDGLLTHSTIKDRHDNYFKSDVLFSILSHES
jgi:hypothetical protein